MDKAASAIEVNDGSKQHNCVYYLVDHLAGDGHGRGGARVSKKGRMMHVVQQPNNLNNSIHGEPLAAAAVAVAAAAAVPSNLLRGTFLAACNVVVKPDCRTSNENGSVEGVAETIFKGVIGRSREAGSSGRSKVVVSVDAK